MTLTLAVSVVSLAMSLASLAYVIRTWRLITRRDAAGLAAISATRAGIAARR